MAGARVMDPSRRGVLAGGGIALAFLVTTKLQRAFALGSPRLQPGDAEVAALDGNATFAPHAFLRIDREGPICLVMPSVEMGQGSHTGQATIMAEAWTSASTNSSSTTHRRTSRSTPCQL